MQAAARAVVSGTGASLTSTAALMMGGRRDCASAFAPVNAVSHWIWKDRALRRNRAQWRYILIGFLIHHVMSIGWAMHYEKWKSGRRPIAQPLALGATAAGVATAACLVDLRCTPERLTPGFERRLQPVSLISVYLAFAVGLTVVDLARQLNPPRKFRKPCTWGGG